MSQAFGGLGVSPIWTIQGAEKSKYESIFDSLGPVSGKLNGDKVRPVLLNSKLPMDVLGRVWELSDIDKDGFLDRDEFCVAMHLVYRAIDKEPVPLSLPPNVIPPSKRSNMAAPTSVSLTAATDRHLPGAVAVLPPMPSSPAAMKRHDSTASARSAASPKHLVTANQTPSQWLVGAADRARFSGIFQKSKDPDNFISGATARNIFVQSGLPQPILAHVWTMCDQQQSGRLSQDQFVIAMHLISQKVKGIELPTQITPEMLSASSGDSGYGDSGSLSDASSGVGDTAAMRELDALNQEIEELRREKESLTSEIQQKELAIRSTDHDVQELQDKLDRDSSSLAQLECDKAEAHTRLEELEQQRNKLDNMLSDVRQKVQEENEAIKSLRAQISAQEASVGQQEIELRKVRSELSDLQKEETQLEQRLEAGRQQQRSGERSVKEAQSEIEKVQSQLQALQEQRKSVSSNIEQYDKAVATLKSESKDDNAFDLHTSTAIAGSDSVFSMGGMQEKVEDIRKDLSEDLFNGSSDPFTNSDPFAGGSDPFGGVDPFVSSAPSTTASSDPFASTVPAAPDDPFSSSTPATSSDPFAGADPFQSSLPESFSTNDPFQTSASTFGFSTDQTTSSSATEVSAPFDGRDPFADSSDARGKSSTFSTDPFSTSDAFSTSNKTTLNTTAASNSTPANIDTDAFAKAFSDAETSKESSSMFAELDKLSASKPKSSEDPWGAAFDGGASKDAGGDPFGSDAFSSDPFAKSSTDTLGKSSSDPFAKSSDPFAKSSDPFAKSSDPLAKSSDPFAKSSDPFAKSSDPFAKSSDPFAKSSDPFAKSSDPFAKSSDPFAKSSSDPFVSSGFSSDPFAAPSDASGKDKPAPPRPSKPADMIGGLSSKAPVFASETEQLKWAKEESKRAEEERLKKKRQEEEDLKLAIALSKQQ